MFREIPPNVAAPMVVETSIRAAFAAMPARRSAIWSSAFSRPPPIGG